MPHVEIAKWENAFPGAWRWCETQLQPYIPGSLVEGSRHEWPRLPYHAKPCGCYLCGEDFDSKPELIAHWRDAHIDAAPDVKDALTNDQVEEEVRKRVFHDEQTAGPFEIRGQEHRRVVGASATHQTHCAPGSGCMNDHTHTNALRLAGPSAVVPFARGACGSRTCTRWTSSRNQTNPTTSVAPRKIFHRQTLKARSPLRAQRRGGVFRFAQNARRRSTLCSAPRLIASGGLAYRSMNCGRPPCDTRTSQGGDGSCIRAAAQTWTSTTMARPRLYTFATTAATHWAATTRAESICPNMHLRMTTG